MESKTAVADSMILSAFFALIRFGWGAVIGAFLQGFILFLTGKADGGPIFFWFAVIFCGVIGVIFPITPRK